MVSPDRFGSMGVAIAIGACVCCGRVFMFDPDLVPSIYARFGSPKGVGDRKLETSDYPKDGFYREPVCPECATRVNAERVKLGKDPIPEHDTAEALIESTGRDGP